jgi:hypothetical protein
MNDNSDRHLLQLRMTIPKRMQYVTYINKYTNTSVTDCDNHIIPWSRAFHEKLTNNSWSRNSLPLMKPSGLVLYSQEPAAAPSFGGCGGGL